jgi:hypothetical protein
MPGLTTIVHVEEDFQPYEFRPGNNATMAAYWMLCVESLTRPSWQRSFEFNTCLANCTATKCRMPSEEAITEERAQECAARPELEVQWADVVSCVASDASKLLAASVARANSACSNCPVPMVFINGAFAWTTGHDPSDPSPHLLRMICGNYTGVKPLGCTL